MGKTHHKNRSKQSKGNKDNNNDNKNKKPTNSKFKQRSSENIKQLARLDQIVGKNRSNSNDGNKDKKDNKRNDSNSKDKFNKGKPFDKSGKGFDRSGSQSRGRNDSRGRGTSESFSRDRVQGNNDRSNNGKFQRNNKNGNKFNNKNNNKFDNNKTKQIGKFKGKGRNPFANDDDDDEQDQQLTRQMPLKGKPLFKIIPQGMDDQFAALGGSDQQQQQYSQEQGQQGQGQQLQGQQELEEQGQYEQDQDMQQDNQEQIDQDDIQDQQQGDQEQLEGEDDQAEYQQVEGYQQEQEQQEVKPKKQSKHIKNQQNVKNQQNQQQQLNNQQQQNPEPVDISVISLKIQQTIQILMNVQRLGAGKPRKYHLQQLKKMIHQYYGYNYQLINHFLDFLNPAEMIQLFEANQTHRPLTIRTNTLKTRRKQLAQSLIQRGVNLDPLAEWSKVGIKIYQSKVPIGATPEYLAGQYMLQSASSLLPVIALDPQVGQKILDMASAPGGKTTYIAQLMKNTGCIFANDLKKQRLRALQFNLYRLGITNTAVTCKDGRKYPTIFPSTFDRVLLDAPCTGLGIIAKDHSIKANRLLLDIYKNSHLQKQLLLAAIDCCKVNGTVVYSTCSISPLQNQQVVNYALKRRFIKIVDCGIQVGEEGLTKFVQKRFHVDLKKTRRIYPHVHNMDGFYVAKLIKVQKGKRVISQQQQKQDTKYQRKYQDQQQIEQDMQIQESKQIQNDQE